jgi:phage shock protein A
MKKSTMSEQQQAYAAAKAVKDQIWAQTMGSDREDIADEEWELYSKALAAEFQAGEELIDWALDAMKNAPETAWKYAQAIDAIENLREKIKTNIVYRKRVIDLTMQLVL